MFNVRSMTFLFYNLHIIHCRIGYDIYDMMMVIICPYAIASLLFLQFISYKYALTTQEGRNLKA